LRTSFGPHAVGGVDAKLNWSEVRAILSSSARKPDASSGGEALGADIVDAASALGEPRLERAGAR
jgi:hypothetical protein